VKIANRKIHSLIVVAAFLLTTILATGALAQDVDAPGAEVSGPPQNIVGLGAALVPEYEGSEDYKVAPVPQVHFKFDNLMYIDILGTTLKVNLVPNKTFNAGPLLRYRGERDDVKNDAVDDMDKVDAAIELGGFVSCNVKNWIFSVSAAQDVSDSHDGMTVDLGLGYRYMLTDSAIFTLLGKATYASEDYMDTYFSVDAADAASSGLDTYDADADWKDVGAMALLQYNITDSWGVLGAFIYKRLLGDAKDSPIVDDEGDPNQYIAGLLVNYRF